MTVPTNLFTIDPLDWETIVHGEPNVLVCGEQPFIEAFLDALKRETSRPIRRCANTRSLLVSKIAAGTLVLDDPSSYDETDQRALLAWLEHDGLEVQLITTTRKPMFDLVQAGRFLDTLFYRLNTIHIELACAAPEHHVARPARGLSTFH